MDKRIGAQLYTLRDFCQTEQDFEKTIEKLHNIGYKVVQLSGVGGDIKPETIREICDKYGMTIACTHFDIDDYENRFDEVVRFHKIVGTNIAGMSYIPADRRQTFGDIKNLVASMNNINDKLAGHGLIFAHHNHAYEFVKYDGKYVMDYMLQHGKFGFITDVYWLAFAGINPAEFITKIGDRCTILHYKDLKVTNENKCDYAEIGEGNLDWNSIIAVSDNAAFALVEQDECAGEPIDCLETSYKFLTAKGFI